MDIAVRTSDSINIVMNHAASIDLVFNTDTATLIK